MHSSDDGWSHSCSSGKEWGTPLSGKRIGRPVFEYADDGHVVADGHEEHEGAVRRRSTALSGNPRSRKERRRDPPSSRGGPAPALRTRSRSGKKFEEVGTAWE
eukprot:10106034-Karenia_brevis.AAC.1